MNTTTHSKTFPVIGSLAAALMTAALVAAVSSAPVTAQNARWGANYFPNIILTTQDGAKVRFYDDLIKGKIVVIDLIYTTCKYSCPLETARLAQVQQILGDRVGRDIFFYSITIDPAHDTPQVLKEYAEKYHAGPGWLFLTGKQSEIDRLSDKLGLAIDPNASNPDGHNAYVLIGNETTGQWMRNSATDNPKFLARTIGDWMNSWQNAKRAVESTTDSSPLNIDWPKYTFTSHCAPCHTIGQGDKIGPDLLGVTSVRDRAWLKRFIKEPDKMMAEGDPIVKALVAKYKVRMANLGLADADIAAVIGYMERETASIRAANEAARK